jgi:TRAF3-interacting protein 1
MSEKLLMKPPFRFLHDTISAIIQTTGFAEGLYSADEMDSATINEKSAKIEYLEKIFGVVGICHVCLIFSPPLSGSFLLTF